MTWCQKKHFKQKHTLVSTEFVNSKSMSLKPDLSYTFSICFCYLLICGHQLTKAGEITREKEEWTQIESNHATDYYWYIFYQTWLKATFVFKSIDRMICAFFHGIQSLLGIVIVSMEGLCGTPVLDVLDILIHKVSYFELAEYFKYIHDVSMFTNNKTCRWKCASELSH